MTDPGNLDETVSGVRDGDLVDLLARVESATKPNFELECALFEALALPTEWFGSKVTSHFRTGGGYGFNTEDGFRHLDCVRAPAYTASLDASLGLVERVLAGWMVENLGELSPECAPVAGKWLAQLRPRQPRRRLEGAITAENLRATFDAADPAGGETAPLALLAALLRALITQAADTSARNVPAREGQKQEPGSSCASPSPPVAMRHGSDANAEPSGKED